MAIFKDASEFEGRVRENLLGNGVDVSSAKIGLAVSGGADSVALLESVSTICAEYGNSIKVVTVNHRIRSDAESGGDADFVEELCSSLRAAGRDVELFTETLAEGEVLRLSEKRGLGIEEAARSLRYAAFERFKKKYSLDFVCLAHNMNDNLETLLMRFIQGSPSSGIMEKRSFYVRPLLDIERGEIEDYLVTKGVSWRTDATNFDEKYLRNRIRGSLVPLLDQKFHGWRKALLSGAEKTMHDDEHFVREVSRISPVAKSDEKIVFSRADIKNTDIAVATRLVFRSLTELKVRGRVPYRMVSDFAGRILSSEVKFEISMGTASFCFDEDSVSVKKPEILATDSSFFAIIEESGKFDFPFGVLNVEEGEDGLHVMQFPQGLLEVRLPVLVRSRQIEDRILTSTGCMKNVSDILSDWRVPAEKKDLVPVVQGLSDCAQEILAVMGSVVGHKNWIVRG